MLWRRSTNFVFRRSRRFSRECFAWRRGPNRSALLDRTCARQIANLLNFLFFASFVPKAGHPLFGMMLRGIVMRHSDNPLSAHPGSALGRRQLFPEIEPYRTGWLKVS